MALNCSRCGLVVPTGGHSCPSCGLPVTLARTGFAMPPATAPATRILGASPVPFSAAPATIAVGAMFGLVVAKTGATIYLPAPVRTYLVGRSDARSGFFPDIDLAPHGAGTGVSRQHARLHACGAEGLSLEVVTTSTMTYVNQRPCVSYEVVALQHGDDLLFGDFSLRILMT